MTTERSAPDRLRRRRAARAVVRSAVAGQRRRVATATVLFSSHQGCEALVPVLIGVIIDHAVSPGASGEQGSGVAGLIVWIALLGLVFAVLSFSYRFGSRNAEAAAEWAAHDLRLRITRRVLDARGMAESGDTDRLPGALANIATSDAQRVGTINSAAPMGFAAVVAMLVGGIALLRLSVPLGLIVLLGGPVLLYLVHLLGKPLENRSEHEQERAAEASGVAADLVAGLRVLKGIGAEDAAVARYRVTSQSSLGATVRAAGAQAAYEGSMLVMSGLFLAVVALFGGRLALQGTISIGDLVAAVGLAQFLLGPLQVFAWVSGELAQGRASAARVADVLDTPGAVGDGGELASSPIGSLMVDDVSHLGLSALSLRVSPGETVGVVSEPADAAALLALLGRDADPASGAVVLDGVPLSSLAPEAVRSAVLVAAHDAELFGGSLASNLSSALPVPDALRVSFADEVVSLLPGGLEGTLSERGGNLSGGQRQRVALARALGSDAPVLVLHDPTTAVDAVTESRIAARLRDVRAGRTTVLVTTSPALLAVTDRVVLVTGGRVTASGDHHELLRGDEVYREMVLG